MLQRDQLGVRIGEPQGIVVVGLLHVHMEEVLADEDRQQAVETQRRTRPSATPALAYQVHLGSDDGQAGLMLGVILAGRLGSAPADRLERRVDHRVLMLEMSATEVEQQAHSGERFGQFGIVVGVHAADTAQRLAHEGADALVNAQVKVVARRPEGGSGTKETHLCCLLKC